MGCTAIATQNTPADEPAIDNAAAIVQRRAQLQALTHRSGTRRREFPLLNRSQRPSQPTVKCIAPHPRSPPLALATPLPLLLSVGQSATTSITWPSSWYRPACGRPWPFPSWCAPSPPWSSARHTRKRSSAKGRGGAVGHRTTHRHRGISPWWCCMHAERGGPAP